MNSIEKNYFFKNLAQQCFLWLHHEARGILVPGPGIEPVPPAVEVQSQPLDHQGGPQQCFLLTSIFLLTPIVVVENLVI